MKLLTITGTRPNFIKEFAFSRACRKIEADHIVIHTGQHYDRNMSDMFFEELDLPTLQSLAIYASLAIRDAMK